MHILFATAELAPVAQVGGLGIAAAGLVAALRELDVDVTVVLPDYGGVALDGGGVALPRRTDVGGAGRSPPG